MDFRSKKQTVTANKQSEFQYRPQMLQQKLTGRGFFVRDSSLNSNVIGDNTVGEYVWLNDQHCPQSVGEDRSDVAGSEITGSKDAAGNNLDHSSVAELCYKISNSHLMDEFFVSLVSSSNHWMFVTNNGAISCGRGEPSGALFPYYSSDKLVDLASSSGPRTVVRLDDGDQQSIVWEPFSQHDQRRFQISRNVYKNLAGNKLYLEESNKTLGLVFRYCWTFSEEFGFVRRCRLVNSRPDDVSVTVLDGLQNILPHGLDESFQLRYSNLGDAYKKSELLPQSQLGLFYLSSIPTDRAEPSEGLRATVAWQRGLDQPKILLSETQLAKFIQGGDVETETDVRGRRGAYFAVKSLTIESGKEVIWDIVADVQRDQTDVIDFDRQLCKSNDMKLKLDRDVAECQRKLLAIVSAADGCQSGNIQLRTHRHQSNVLFNAMRGGIPVSQYQIGTSDFAKHVNRFNHIVYRRNQLVLDALRANGDEISLQDLRSKLQQTGDADLVRIGLEYLPLTFSRRHGDPTRPWNAFSIDVHNDDGSSKVSYQGNWRDIFQNWEALAVSYPDYLQGMVFRFVNASTADGYNPYRLTSEGFEWEAVDPNDAWGNIGYWGDHQIVYLLKLLELSRDFDPDGMNAWLDETCCTYAQVPYRIRPYEEMLRDSKETIDFDYELEQSIQEKVALVGADGKLLPNKDGSVHRASLLEKLLLPALVKLANFVPGGGIWLNTQRPEWNDANNALVGNGLSVVTVCYMRRYIAFLRDWMAESSIADSHELASEVAALLNRIGQTLASTETGDSMLTDESRKLFVDQLSTAGSEYRCGLYQNGFSGDSVALSKSDLNSFFESCLAALDNTIRVNRREDGLYHSYNLMSIEDSEIKIEHLQEMLEGQVAALSCGLLTPEAAADLLDALRASPLYRADQHSYTLYPDRELPRFVEKNAIPSDKVAQSELLKLLVSNGDQSLIRVDATGGFHFNGDFRNEADLRTAIENLADDERYEELAGEELDSLFKVFEDVFEHRRFTGRSGTFFAYEGLGSIYWHMVSKLALATMENMVTASQTKCAQETINRLHEKYREIRNGIAYGKSPREYGAFPSDPYSHTPAGAGVKQPGMTGQVKEDILSRFTELGLRLRDGVICFDTTFFERDELVNERSRLAYVDLLGNMASIDVPQRGFGWTLCQVPIVYSQKDVKQIAVFSRDAEGVETVSCRDETCLTRHETKLLCSRAGLITRIEIAIPK